MTNSSRLRNEEAVLDALAQGMTYAQAADTAGVVVSTVARYMQDPDFTFRLRLRNSTTANTVRMMLTARCVEATERLHGEMNNQQNAASIRVRAAHALLTTALQWRDADIDERLTSLEELARQH